MVNAKNDNPSPGLYALPDRGSKFVENQVAIQCTMFRYDKIIKRPYEKIRLGRIVVILFKILCVQVFYNSMQNWSSRAFINIGTRVNFLPVSRSGNRLDWYRLTCHRVFQLKRIDHSSRMTDISFFCQTKWPTWFACRELTVNLKALER